MDFMREPALWLWAIHHYRGTISWAPNFAYTLCAKRIPDAELEGLDLSIVAHRHQRAPSPCSPRPSSAFTARFAAVRLSRRRR